jgi:hypothetical protein
MTETSSVPGEIDAGAKRLSAKVWPDRSSSLGWPSVKRLQFSMCKPTATLWLAASAAKAYNMTTYYSTVENAYYYIHT